LYSNGVLEKEAFQQWRSGTDESPAKAAVVARLADFFKSIDLA